MNEIKTKGAHGHSANHRSEIEASAQCGCFFCVSIYPSSEIVDWVDEDDNGIGATALCPQCGVDSVIGDASGFSINKAFLSAMHRHWF